MSAEFPGLVTATSSTLLCSDSASPGAPPWKVILDGAMMCLVSCMVSRKGLPSDLGPDPTTPRPDMWAPGAQQVGNRAGSWDSAGAAGGCREALEMGSFLQLGEREPLELHGGCWCQALGPAQFFSAGSFPWF